MEKTGSNIVSKTTAREVLVLKVKDRKVNKITLKRSTQPIMVSCETT